MRNERALAGGDSEGARAKRKLTRTIPTIVLPFLQSAIPFGRESEVTHAAYFQTTFLERRAQWRAPLQV